MIGQEEIARRFTSHPCESWQIENMIAVRDAIRTAAEVVDGVSPDGREKSLAVTALEEAVFWANAAIARPVVEPRR